MNKKIIIAVIVLAIAVGAWWMFSKRAATDTTAETPATSDSTQLTGELDGLNQLDIDAELGDIDTSLKQL